VHCHRGLDPGDRFIVDVQSLEAKPQARTILHLPAPGR
jgi:hypothetical protein